MLAILRNPCERRAVATNHGESDQNGGCEQHADQADLMKRLFEADALALLKL
jgi:hypothetical protein